MSKQDTRYYYFDTLTSVVFVYDTKPDEEAAKGLSYLGQSQHLNHKVAGAILVQRKFPHKTGITFSLVE